MIVSRRSGEALSPEDVITELRKEGYTDAEIEDQFARLGRMAVEPDDTGHLRWTRGDASTLHQRRILADRLAQLHVKPMTQHAREKGAAIRKGKDYLRRTTGRVTVAGLARRAEIDRGTLQRWIDEG